MPRWSSLRALRPQWPRLRTVFLSMVLFWTVFTLLITYYILFHHAFPIRRAYWLETEYLHRLGYDDFADEMQVTIGKLTNGTIHRPRSQPLIHDVAQLHYWRLRGSRTYDEWLGLNFDGTGIDSCRGKEYWIYAGGTAEIENSKGNGKSQDREERDPTVFSHQFKQHNCVDPPYICDSWNNAFDKISERWHSTSATGHPKTSSALLRYVDCDVSPLLCHYFWGLGVNVVMLAHMKIHTNCDWSMGFGRCPVTWRFYALPMKTAPWTRMIRIPLHSGGSTVVPAFPSAEEQLWNLLAHSGAEIGLLYSSGPDDPIDSDNTIIEITPIEDQPPEYSSWLGFWVWGTLRNIVDNSFVWPEPREILIKCYVERYLDVVLRWWDGAKDVVRPRSCETVVEEWEAAQQRREAWVRVNKDLGLDPDRDYI